MRIIAVDWSGAKARPGSRIWLAEARDGVLSRLESGRDRGEVVDHLVELARHDPDLVVGLDFAFAFPAWFTRDVAGAEGIEALWRHVADEGERWLTDCPPPFWGRPGRRKPELPEHFRRTERVAAEPVGSQPKSVFQIGGAGAVGTGSIRGMPHLLTLRAAGFFIWPFHGAALPLVLEIYPRLLTGPVTKSDPEARRTYLRGAFPEILPRLEAVAAASEDAFDAAVSAVVMARHEDALKALRPASDPTERLEGRIWWPEEACAYSDAAGG